MKPMTQFFRMTLAAALAATAFSAAADDLGPDKAIELVEQAKIKHFRDLNAIVMGLHPGASILDTELEDNYGKIVYAVEVRDGNNKEWNVDLDATSGEVLKNREDNDD